MITIEGVNFLKLRETVLNSDIEFFEYPDASVGFYDFICINEQEAYLSKNYSIHHFNIRNKHNLSKDLLIKEIESAELIYNDLVLKYRKPKDLNEQEFQWLKLYVYKCLKLNGKLEFNDEALNFMLSIYNLLFESLMLGNFVNDRVSDYFSKEYIEYLYDIQEQSGSIENYCYLYSALDDHFNYVKVKRTKKLLTENVNNKKDIEKYKDELLFLIELDSLPHNIIKLINSEINLMKNDFSLKDHINYSFNKRKNKKIKNYVYLSYLNNL